MVCHHTYVRGQTRIEGGTHRRTNENSTTSRKTWRTSIPFPLFVNDKLVLLLCCLLFDVLLRWCPTTTERTSTSRSTNSIIIIIMMIIIMRMMVKRRHAPLGNCICWCSSMMLTLLQAIGLLSSFVLHCVFHDPLVLLRRNDSFGG